MIKYLAITLISIVVGVVALSVMYSEPKAARGDGNSVECPVCPSHNA